MNKNILCGKCGISGNRDKISNPINANCANCGGDAWVEPADFDTPELKGHLQDIAMHLGLTIKELKEKLNIPPTNKYDSGYLLLRCHVDENEMDDAPEVAAIPLKEMSRLRRLVATGLTLFDLADELIAEANGLGKIGFNDHTPDFYTGIDDIAPELYQPLWNNGAIIVQEIPMGLRLVTCEGRYLMIYNHDREKISWQSYIKHTSFSVATEKFSPREFTWDD